MSTASITIEVHRGTVDPEGLFDDQEFETCREYILDYTREAFPGAYVSLVGPGGRTGGVDEHGEDLTSQVRAVVQYAFEDYCAVQAGKRDRT